MATAALEQAPGGMNADRARVFIAITSMILVSIVVTVLLNILRR